MASLLERLADALAPAYRLERELGGGGMGTVFLAHDVALDRPVAIKILRPELATAEAAERFLREARILARLSHPNIVSVHTAGEAEGLFYYVMDYVEGETLEQRLAREPMSVAAGVRVGVQLLDALEAVHRLGIVHRDVKPGNVFLVGERAVLSDFGIAKPEPESTEPLTAPGRSLGTPHYMAPEQALDEEITPRSDLYAVGMIVYQALTGRRWSVLAATARADWAGVPAPVARVLRRALAWAPEQRWADAATFRRALELAAAPARRRTGVIVLSMALAGGVGLSVFLLISGSPRAPPPADVAVVPLDVVGELESGFGRDLARLTTQRLAQVPAIRAAPTRSVFPLWERLRDQPDLDVAVLHRRLRVRYLLRGTVTRSAGGVEVELEVADSLRGSMPFQRRLRTSTPDLLELSDGIAVELVQFVHPEFDDPLDAARPSDNFEALRHFLQGEEAFERGAPRSAVRLYQAAVELDPDFALAWWRLANAWRWLGTATPYTGVDLDWLHERSSALGPANALVLEAQLAPPGEPRFRIYEEARRRYPDDGSIAFHYGDELFHRGALFGRPTESAAQVLREAAALDSLLAPAYEHLAWALIRLGMREESRSALDHLGRIAAAPGEVDFDPRPYLELAYLERFEPDSAMRVRERLVGSLDSGSLQALAVAVRLPLSADLPAVEVAFGEIIAARAATRSRQASGHLAQGLGLVALGRTTRALAHFDSAAELFASREAAFQAAEWRVFPRALGVPGSGEDEPARGRRDLERWIEDDSFGARAAWVLAMDAYAVGDTVAASRWQARLGQAPGDSPAARLHTLLEAMHEAALGRFQAALSLTQPLAAYQVSGEPLRDRNAPRTWLGDPFARAALHLRRGEWFERLGDLKAAEREWLWHEAADFVGWPGAEVQAGEVEWALGTYARLRRARAAFAAGEEAGGCALIRRVLELWSAAEPALVQQAEQAGTGCS